MVIKQIVIEGDSGVDYVIDADDAGRARCSCPDFRFTRAPLGDVCKHIRFVADSVRVATPA